jgi:Na+-translocating ferredoxin:NAD+ oxidoreductase RnfD subunit
VPSRSDPRLRLAVVIVGLQVLGQLGLGFKLSVAQILASIGVCALVEIAITYRQQHVLVWPASAILTGNSTAFILRANGTHHGDWWSLNGIEFFILASLVGILSKYVIRWGGRHLYNPSNLGLVLCFLIIGATHVFPQYLWWGPMNLPVALALLVILAGAIWVLRPLQMLPMVAAFLVTFAILIAAIAASGGCFLATWHAGPICGSAYWFNICTSPELLVFTFFMISDPRTAPQLPLARVIYGVAIAVLAAALILPQPSEYGIKVALLASLTVVCSFVLVLDRLSARILLPSPFPRGGERSHEALPTPSLLSFFAAVAITLGVPSATVALASNQQVVDIDSGINTPGTPIQ